MELTTDIKTAEAAKELSQKNGLTMDGVMNNIATQCKNGSTKARFFDIDMPIEIMQKLLQLGYAISTDKGQFKEDITIVSW